MIDGFMKGLYNNNSEGVRKECMDQNTVAAVIKLNDILKNGDLSQLFKSLSTVYQITFTLDKKCKMTELDNEILGWCIHNNCSFTDISINLQKNIFVLTGAFNEVMSLFYNQEATRTWTDLDNAFATFQTLGKNLGKITRTILTFTKTSSEIKDDTTKPTV
jgi:hypothetical protein